jgi:putative membrane protein
MRVLLRVLIGLAFIGGGVLFGAFNPQTARIDFHWFQVSASLGIVLLIAVFLGAAIGGVAVTVGIVWPLQRRLRKAQRESVAPRAPVEPQSSQPVYPA